MSKVQCSKWKGLECIEVLVKGRPECALFSICCETKGRFPFVRTGRSDWSIRRWNARVLGNVRTGSGRSGPAYGVGPLSSPGPNRNSDITREFYVLKMVAGSSQTCGAYNRFIPKFCTLFCWRARLLFLKCLTKVFTSKFYFIT